MVILYQVKLLCLCGAIDAFSRQTFIIVPLVMLHSDQSGGVYDDAAADEEVFVGANLVFALHAG